ncbi:phage GP46 family protein [Cronobacter sakazakii]
MISFVNGLLKESTDYFDDLTRSVIISLFSWRRAEADDDTEIPFGWWGDTFPSVGNDRIGSRLYLLQRSKLTNATATRAKDYARQALAWMEEDGVAARVDVAATRTGINSLQLEVTIWQQDGSKHAIIFDDIWQEVLNG